MVLPSFAFLALVASAAAKPATTPSKIQWSSCPSPIPEGVDGAQLKVPVDWSKPKGNVITLGLTKLNATDPRKRIGNLFYNPGGPGEGASVSLSYQAAGIPYFGESLSTHFDIIGVDPRGVGLSTPIQCDPEIWNKRVSMVPQNADEYLKMCAHNKAVWDGCLTATGGFLSHVDTTSVAHDIEAVRKALGDEKLNYLGTSYGTQLGAAYAELFPDNYRAMALDAQLDHSQSETSTLIAESTTYEIEMKAFFAWCSSSSHCALHDQNVTETWTSLIQRAATSPIPAPGCIESGACYATVTDEDIRSNAQGMLSFKDPIEAAGVLGWNSLAIALAEATSGNATLLATPLATSNTDPPFASLAISCNDWTASSTKYSDLLHMIQLANNTFPITAGLTQSYTTQKKCIGFPKPVANPPHYANVTNGGSLPVLMTQSTRDPSCNPEWAVGLQAQIENSVLVWRDGDGHTSYDLLGKVSKLIEAYLVNKTLPAAGSVYSS